jgi:hypothetical protein
MTNTQRIASLLTQRRALIERVRFIPRADLGAVAVKEAKTQAASLMAEVERIEQRQRWEARFAS